MSNILNINQVKIGTITALYNNEKYISDCIDSLFQQSHKPNYIVIIDDQSTDNSVNTVIEKLNKLSKCEELSNHKKWNYNGIEISLILREINGGPAAARNIGLKYLLNKCHFFQICDSDDVLYPKKIEKSLNIFRQYSNIALVYSDYDILDEKTNKITREYKEIFSYRRLIDECIVSNNSCIAMNIVSKIGYYSEEFRGMEDFDYWLKIADIAAVYHIPESLSLYRVHQNNITITTPSDKFARGVQIVKERARQRLNAKFQNR